MVNDFQTFVQNANESEAHSQEIQQTRIGGLGGSDAAMMYKIGHGGMAALSNTDMKRLAVMCGLSAPENFGGNMYTQAGHKFEDWYEQKVVEDVANGQHYEREHVMSAQFAANFKTFAHADFMLGEDFVNPTIVECKFVSGKDTDAVEKQYYAQLQWYYMLGARSVNLLHGAGTVDDAEAGTEFAVLAADMRKVERDEDFIKFLLVGIATLDKAIGKGWTPVVRDKVDYVDTPDAVQEAFNKLAVAKLKAEEAKTEEKEAKEVLGEYMSCLGFNKIINAETGHQVYVTAAKTSSKFDLKAFTKIVTEKAGGDANASMTLGEILAAINDATKLVKVAETTTFK